MNLHTEFLNFNTFQLFICLFLTADRLSQHEYYNKTSLYIIVGNIFVPMCDWWLVFLTVLIATRENVRVH